MPHSLVFLAAACALAYLPLSPKPAGLVRTLLKTAAVALLSVAAILQNAPALLAIALGLCALGDMALSRETDRSFMLGIGAFALGHLAYIAVFLLRQDSSVQAMTVAPTAALSVLGVAAAILIVPRAGDLKLPVLVYIPIILGMGFAAMTLPSGGRIAWALPAALAFIASDLILAVEKFLLPPTHPALRLTPYLIWPLYWGAQAGFVLAFA